MGEINTFESEKHYLWKGKTKIALLWLMSLQKNNCDFSGNHQSSNQTPQHMKNAGRAPTKFAPGIAENA
jgi:hypothetical protein